MKEDIKILEEFIRIDRLMRSPAEDYSHFDEFCERRCIAIENILKERKELIKGQNSLMQSRKKWKERYYKEKDKKLMEFPKRKIQDKIDELNTRINKYNEYRKLDKETDVEYYDNIGNEIARNILQELLEDKGE